jgi:hypothetical protein
MSNQESRDTKHDPKHTEPQGIVEQIVGWLVRALLRMLGIGGREVRRSFEAPDSKYQAYIDDWATERLAYWLNQTRPDIRKDHAERVLRGEGSSYPESAELVRQTLIDARVTFLQRDGKQFIEIESYMSPRQKSAAQPEILRWRSEREIAWQEIPNEVRERLIRERQPITLAYAMPS